MIIVKIFSVNFKYFLDIQKIFLPSDMFNYLKSNQYNFQETASVNLR